MFPSKFFGRPFREGAFDAPGPEHCDDRERTCAELAAEWRQLKREWPNGNKSRVACWAPGCVVRMAIGGVGGRRILGMAPAPVLWSVWADMTCDHRRVRGFRPTFWTLVATQVKD